MRYKLEAYWKHIAYGNCFDASLTWLRKYCRYETHPSKFYKSVQRRSCFLWYCSSLIRMTFPAPMEIRRYKSNKTTGDNKKNWCFFTRAAQTSQGFPKVNFTKTKQSVSSKLTLQPNYSKGSPIKFPWFISSLKALSFDHQTW